MAYIPSDIESGNQIENSQGLTQHLQAVQAEVYTTVFYSKIKWKMATFVEIFTISANKKRRIFKNNNNLFGYE